MAQNIGTLVGAAIRPNDSLDPISSAFASEIKGGLHTAATSTDRNNIIIERREWGMMCYVTNLDKTFQLKYGYSNVNIMDNNNWVEFSGSGGGGGGSVEWIDSVISVGYSQPASPINGDRYLIGLEPSSVLIGASWSTFSPGVVGQWNSTLSRWDLTTPTEGMSVRVDNELNSIYKYEGVYSTGGWKKERLQQVRTLTLFTGDSINYTSTSNPPFSSYETDTIFIVTYPSTNSTSLIYIDVNGIGNIQVKKPSATGLVDFYTNEIVPGVMYSLTYDGTYFQSVKPFSNDDFFAIKYYIEPTDYIVVPQYYQYWVYGDLTVAGQIVNYGHVVIANGNLVMSGGTFSNLGSGQLALVNLTAGTTSVQLNDTDTIDFQVTNLITGISASAVVKHGSLTASHLNTYNNGGATAGSILSVDNNGFFQWIDGTLVGGGIQGVTAGIGLTGGGNSGYIQLDLDIDVTNSGLTYSGNSLVVSIDNSSIQLNTSGQLYVSGGGSTPIYQNEYSLVTVGDNQPTGLTLSNVPTVFSSIQVYINGQLQTLGDGLSFGFDCYFYDGFVVKSFNNLSVGDELYWNGIISNFDLNSQDLIQVIYES